MVTDARSPLQLQLHNYYAASGRANRICTRLERTSSNYQPLNDSIDLSLFSALRITIAIRRA